MTELESTRASEVAGPAGAARPGAAASGAAEAGAGAGVGVGASGGVGEPGQLGAAREARGWSVAEVAGKLGMAARQIEALERGEWNALPGQAFVRGAIRAYAKLLQLDATALIESVGGSIAAAELRAAASLDTPIPRHGALGFERGGAGSRFAWIALAALGLIAVAMYFGRGAEPSPAPDAAEVPGGRAGSVVEPAAVTPAGEAPGRAPAAASTVEPRAPVAAAAPHAAALPAAATSVATTAATTAATSAATTAAGAARPLTLRFERDAWVEVRDANGKLLVEGVQRAGSERVIEGARPYSLVVGNSRHVRVDDGGREIDLAPVARRDVARLRID